MSYIEIIGLIESGRTDELRNFIKKHKVDVNYRFPENHYRTMLHKAASFGSEDAVKMLVEEFHTDINIENVGGEVALHEAANNNYMNVVKYLVKKGSNYSEDVEYMIPSKKKNVAFVTIYGVVFKKIMRGTQSFVFVKMNYAEIIQIIREGKTIELRNFIKVDVDYRFPENHYRTMLHKAASFGNVEMVRMLTLI